MSRKNEAASVIQLLKKKTKVDLSFGKSLWVKKISYTDGALFIEGKNDEAQILYHACLLDEEGPKFFNSVKQAEDFLEVCPLSDVDEILKHTGAYRISDKELAKN